MGLDFGGPTEKFDFAAYAANVTRRLPLRSVHITQLPGIRLHHTAVSCGQLEPERYCEKAWAAGRWLAGYILRNPQQFAGKSLLDIGTGSGIVAIAAARAGAKVTAIDQNERSILLAGINATANNVAIILKLQHASRDLHLGGFDIITAADAVYEPNVKDAFITTIKHAAQSATPFKAIISDQSSWDLLGLGRFIDRVEAAGGQSKVIKGGKKFLDPDSPINNNPVTALKVCVSPR